MKIGRNDPCPCGSGKKNKKCCNMREDTSIEEPKELLPDDSTPFNKNLISGLKSLFGDESMSDEEALNSYPVC